MGSRARSRGNSIAVRAVAGAALIVSSVLMATTSGASSGPVTTTTTTTTPSAPTTSGGSSAGSPDVTTGGGASAEWGWDTFGGSTALTASYLSTAKSDYGGHYPADAGLYLDHGSSGLLTSAVVSAVRNDGIGIYLISDLADSSTGQAGTGSKSAQQQGAADAATAASYAENTLHVPANDGIAIYADNENTTAIASGYITGWYNTLEADGFIPGFYANPTSGDFNGAFCGTSSTVQSGTILWMDEPNGGMANKYYPTAPWNPSVPSCLNGSTQTVAGWQFLNGLTFPGIPAGAMTFDLDSFSPVGAWY
jgi:hypothetical protein